MDDVYGESGSAKELLAKFGQTPGHIVEEARAILKR
jgi:transketolase C-terminal domain/subunit